MNADEGRRLEIGAEIQLNELAAAWTKGRKFHVTQLRQWGVICATKPAANDREAHAVKSSGLAYYAAQWDQIVSRQDILGVGIKDVTGNYPD